MAFPWKIRFRPQAIIELQRAPQHVRRELARALREMRFDPVIDGSEPLEFGSRKYRKFYLPSGYRMIYLISNKHRRIYIERIRLHDYSGFSD